MLHHSSRKVCAPLDSKLHSLYAAQGTPVYACAAWKHLFVVHTHNRQSVGFSSIVLLASIRRKAPVSLSISSVDCTLGIATAFSSAIECFCNSSNWSARVKQLVIRRLHIIYITIIIIRTSVTETKRRRVCTPPWTLLCISVYVYKLSVFCKISNDFVIGTCLYWVINEDIVITFTSSL